MATFSLFTIRYWSLLNSGSSQYFLGKRSILAFVSTCRFLLLVCDGYLWLLFLHCSVFLVRESTTVSGCFVLTMYAYGTFRNFQIQKVHTAQPYHHQGTAACDHNHMSLCTCRYYVFTYTRTPDCRTLNSVNYI